jgi:hypothetical protein
MSVAGGSDRSPAQRPLLVTVKAFFDSATHLTVNLSLRVTFKLTQGNCNGVFRFRNAPYSNSRTHNHLFTYSGSSINHRVGSRRQRPLSCSASAARSFKGVFDSKMHLTVTFSLTITYLLHQVRVSAIVSVAVLTLKAFSIPKRTSQ